jgi:hypothetical protein
LDWITVLKRNLQKSTQIIRTPIAPRKQLAIRHRFLEGFGIACLAVGIFLGLSMLSYRPAKNATQLIIYAANNVGGELGYHVARYMFAG